MGAMMTDETSVEETTATPATDDDDKKELGTTESHTDDETEGNEPEGEETEGEESDGTKPTAAPKKNRVQKRFDQLTRKVRDLERELARAGRPAEAEKPQAQQPTEPKPEDYGQDYPAYIRAVARYEAHQVQVEKEQQTQQETQQQKEQERIQRFVQADDDFAAQNADYRGAREIGEDPDFQITQPMVDAITESDIGPQLLHYLDTHPDELGRIAQLSNTRAIAALGALEARLAKQSEQAAARPKTVTQAPPPVPTAKPSAPSSKDPEKMSVAEWMKWRESKLSK